VREIVVDASVVMKWYLPDERWGGRALRLLEMHVTGDVALLAPSLLPYEVLNALLVAERRGRTEKWMAEEAFEAFRGLELTLVDPFAFDVLSLARPLGRSVYDAAYLSVAAAKKTDLITADERLYHAARERLKWVRWIGEEALADMLNGGRTGPP
jgi:predicted nucleic acid-binding protein